MKKNIRQIWLQQSFNDVLLNWKEYIIIFRDNFILIPSTMLIFGYLLGFINELNRETIEYCFLSFGFLSVFINTVLKAALKVFLPSYPLPYISKGIEDIRDSEDSEKTYIYFLKLKFGNYTIKEKNNYIDIIKDDETYSVNTKKKV